MIIHQTPSPNHDSRALPISLLVLHYTGMETGRAALDRLRDPTARVSAHYVVEEDGRVFQLVAEDRRAWHAGKGVWRGCADVNSASIGIEIVNGGHDFGLPPFAEAQIGAVIALCQAILARHPIDPFGVIGHSDLAPDRKIDPGERFPWARLAAAGIGVWPRPSPASGPDPDPDLALGDAGPAVLRLKARLAGIGYGVSSGEVFDDALALVVAAFQRRFRPDLIDGRADAQTRSLIASLAAMAG